MKNRKNGILFLTYGINPTIGGIERYTYTIADFLSKSNDIYYYSFSNDIIKKFNCVKKIRYFDKFFLPIRVANFIKSKNIKKIFCMHLYLTKYANSIAKRSNLNYSSAFYGIECWGGGINHYKEYFTKLDHFYSISSFTTAQLIEQGIKSEKISYLPPLVDTEKYQIASVKSTFSPLKLLTVGRLSSSEQYKGHDTTIKAVAELKKRGRRVEYTIVGKGDDFNRLQSLSSELGIQEQIFFAGFIPDEKLIEYYLNCDIFIMPSKTLVSPGNCKGEGFGIVFIEAAACGKPLIGPNNGGATDVIIDGYNGIQCSPDSVNDIAVAVEKMMDNPDLCLLMGSNARKYVCDKFSLAKINHYLKS